MKAVTYSHIPARTAARIRVTRPSPLNTISSTLKCPLSLLIIALSLLTLSVPVAANQASQHAAQPLSVMLSAGFGTRTGDLQWSIASDISGTATPNILSELTFSDVDYDIYQTSGRLTFNHGQLHGIQLEGRYLAGEASSGTNQDSDYHGDNRTDEYSRSYSDADGSDLIAIDLIVGYEMKLNDNWSLIPRIAYGYREQHMRMTNGVQILDTRPHALSLGPFAGNLDSSYTAEWEGIWIGGELSWQSGRHRVSAELQGHWQDYYAEANWNLREDFAHPVSFAHWSEATGFSWALQYEYRFHQRFSAWVEASVEDFEADPGRDVVYFADGSKGATRLNGVTWESSGYALGVALNF